MLQSTKYMYLIKSKMMDLDSTRAFKPFLTTLIIKEKIQKSFDEQLADSFYKEYGFKLPFFILTNIIYSYISDGFAENLHSFLYFKIEEMKSLPQVDNSDFDIFSIQYESFIDKFIDYCDSADFHRNKAEDVVMSFIKTYDTDLIVGNLQIPNFEDMDIERYLFYTFIKDIRESDTKTYDFLIRLCQGNLIKSYLFNEGVSSTLKEQSIIFLDSPILYRVLGYYGDYYQNEYEYLIKLWIAQGYQLFVYDHNFEEMEFLLRKCLEMIDEVHFNYAKAPQITQTFKEMGWDSVDIEKEIGVFEEKLNLLGIHRYTVDYNNLVDKYLEDQDEIAAKIKQIYSIRQPLIIDDAYNYGMKKMIDTDAKSVFCTYALRGNNKVKDISGSLLFYVTNNSGLTQAIQEYNKEKYPSTISPIVRDSLIGLIACSNDMQKIHEIVEKKIISLCYSTYRPTRRVLEIFTNQVESMKIENQITDEQYLLLKHNKTILPMLTELTEGKFSKIDYQTIHGLIAKVEQTYTGPIRDEYEKKLEILKHEKEMHAENEKKLEKAFEKSLIELEQEKSKVVANEEELIKYKQQVVMKRDLRINTMINRVTKFVNILVIVLTLFIIGVNLLVYINEGYSFLAIMLSIISLISFVYNVFVILFRKLWQENFLVSIVINRRKRKIHADYDHLVK